MTNSFVTVFDRLNVYCNEEKTRTFVGLDIKSGHSTLLLLIKQLDISLDEFRLSPYYKVLSALIFSNCA